jgi:hypothetical protein
MAIPRASMHIDDKEPHAGVHTGVERVEGWARANHIDADCAPIRVAERNRAVLARYPAPAHRNTVTMAIPRASVHIDDKERHTGVHTV